MDGSLLDFIISLPPADLFPKTSEIFNFKEMLSFPYIANALGLLRKNFIGELDDQLIGQVCPVLSLIAFLLMVGKQ